MLEIKGLTKSYNGRWVLKGVDMTVPAGSIFGLLGANGAGKSTMLSIVSGLEQPSAGIFRIDGKELNGMSGEEKKLIGIVPQDISLYQELTAQENLWFWGRLYRMPRYELKKRISTVLGQVGLSDVRGQRVRTFSGGMKRRLNLAASILHQPRVLLLDEPTVGVDPYSRKTIYSLIEGLREEGMSIVLATHYIEEVEKLSDRVGILHEGKMVAVGSIPELMLDHGSGSNYRIEAEGGQLSDIKMLEPHGGLLFDAEHNHFRLEGGNAKDRLPDVLAQLMANGMRIRSVESMERGLESVFIKLTNKKWEEDYA